MAHERPVWILSGPYGRATLNLNDRALVVHAHRQINVLVKLGGADATFEANHQQLALDDSSLLLFNSWLPHGKFEGAPSLILSLFLEPDWLSAIRPSVGPKTDALFYSPRQAITDEIRMLSNRLGAAIPDQDTDNGEVAGQLLETLVDAIIDTYADESIDRAVFGKRRVVDYRIRRALGYIHENALGPLRMEEVAKQVGMSRSRFFEQFKRCVGTSPQHYANFVRVTAATRRLSTSDVPLIELADELGFADHSNFTRFFTQHIGVPPSDFRRQTMEGT